MRLSLSLTAALLVVSTVSCYTPSVKGYWEKHSPDITDISTAENEFARFAELAIASAEEDAQAEIDRLFDILKENEVAYYVYTRWVVSAFYAPLSPCRNCPLFVYSMKRILGEGIIDGYDADLYSRFVTACLTNHIGEKLQLPALFDSSWKEVEYLPGQPTLFLVVDLTCHSCIGALNKMSSSHSKARHIALCSGPGHFPEISGWEYYYAIDTDSIYDAEAAPFYFYVNSDDIVEITYTSAL